MKVGIITFHSAISYGAVLQAYALMKYLRRIGHDPFFINYRFRCCVGPKGLRAWLSRSPTSMAAKLCLQFQRPVFRRFRKDYLSDDCRRDYGDYDLQSAPPVADAYLCGSDQIWSPTMIPIEEERAAWLNFGGSSVRRISYAASFGVSHLDETTRCRWTNYAKRFHAVSVREEEGVEIAATLGRSDAVWVPDPSLLLDSLDYDNLESASQRQEAPFIFSYFLRSANNRLPLFLKNAVQANMQMPCYEVYGTSVHNLFRGRTTSPCEWISNLRTSRFVITNSFHGLAFSIIFRIPFAISLHEGLLAEKNVRVTSLLRAVGLEHRALSHINPRQVEQLCRDEIDWRQVDARLGEYRERGLQFLSNALA